MNQALSKIIQLELEKLENGSQSLEETTNAIQSLMPQAEAQPFLIKSTQHVAGTAMSTEQRLDALKNAGYNVFHVGENTGVLVDFLTDSGTGSMSDKQWAALMQATEWYAGSKSFLEFENAFKEVCGNEFTILPAHQGRSAESTFLEALKKAGIVKENQKIVFNTAFDTTHGWVTNITGHAPENLYCEAYEKPLDHDAPFKGNLEPNRLKERITQGGVGAVFLTITNNTSGGQPVSLENIQATRQICDANHVPLFFDACRFAENAYFIQQKEPGQNQKTIRDIVRDMFSYVDGATFSAKKDAKANIGGAILIRNGFAGDKVAYHAKTLTIMRDGFISYGGLAGRDLEITAQGLRETTQEDYLRQRVGQVQYLHRLLHAAGVPLVHPCGGHAVYVDAREFLDGVPEDQYRGWTLSLALFAKYGIRGVEIGDVMYAKKDGNGKRLAPAKNDFLRLAIPRLTYASEHMLYTAACFADFSKRRKELSSGVRITGNFENNGFDHFFARFEPVDPENFRQTLLT